MIKISVSDPYHFDTDPDPGPVLDPDFLNFFCITMFFVVVILSLLFAYIKQSK